MTGILGYADGQNVWIGGDSFFSDGTWDRFENGRPKMFRVGEALIAVAGSSRTSQIIQYDFSLPARGEALDDMAYITIDVTRALNETLVSNGAAMLTDSEHFSNLLLGYRGKLYYVLSDYTVHPCNDQCGAIGAGKDHLRTAFKTLRRFLPEMSVEDAIVHALEITASLYTVVTPPFHLERITYAP